MTATTNGTRRALLRAAGVLAVPALIGRAQAAALRMRLSSSLPNDPKYANGRTFFDQLQHALAENGLADRIEVREGSFFDPFETVAAQPPQGPPDAEDLFDLVVTNPPFVISPATGERLVLIDVPQAVDVVGNPQGVDFLARDCRNVATWFAARGLDVDGDELLADLLAYAF